MLKRLKNSEMMNRSPLTLAFGSAVRALRKSLAITQEEVAWRAGLHRTYVTNVERGVCNLSLESIGKLAKAMGTSISSLLVDVEVSETKQRKTGAIDFGAAKGPAEILLAEDDPEDTAAAVRALREAGLSNRIQAVYDSAEALDFVFCAGPYAGRDIAHQPSLILLDLGLPNAGGLEVLRRLKEDPRTRPIPVVILTAEERVREVAEYSRLGAETWITKPVNFERLSQVLPKLNFRWLLLKQDERQAA